MHGTDWQVEHDGRDVIGVAGHVDQTERIGAIPFWPCVVRLRFVCHDEHDICHLF